MGRSVEDFGYRSEGLLASCVPDLQLEEWVFNFDTAGAKVDSHSHVVLCVEPIFRQPSQYTRLSNT